MTQAHFYCKFRLGETVMIDGDRSLVGTITAVMFQRPDFVKYEVSYIHNGDAKQAWIDDFRVEPET